MRLIAAEAYPDVAMMPLDRFVGLLVCVIAVALLVGAAVGHFAGGKDAEAEKRAEVAAAREKAYAEGFAAGIMDERVRTRRRGER